MIDDSRTPNYVQCSVRYLPTLALLLALAAPATVGAARVPLPQDFRVHYAPCPDEPDALGCAYSTGDIYVTDRAPFTRWHEVGHLFDQQVLTDPDRAWLTARLGFAPGTPWMPASDDAELAPPGEVFADAYATCAMGLSPAGRLRGDAIVVNWPDGYGYLPTVGQHREVCNAVAVYGLVRGYKYLGVTKTRALRSSIRSSR